MIDILNGYSAVATISAADIRPKRLGSLGEQAVIRLAQSQGMLAGKADMYRGDVFTVANGGTGNVQHIEVKTALLDKRGTFQFCLKRSIGNRVCTDCHYADVVVLLAVDNAFKAIMFVIPVSDIGAQKKINISNPANPNGKYAKYIRATL